MDTNNSANEAFERSPEELAWDAEFANMKDESPVDTAASVLGDVFKLLVQVPVAIIQMPLAILPEDTAKHARAAAREGFLAVRSLLGAVGDGIESMLSESSGKGAAVEGPAGTWGHARQSGKTSTAPGKVKRIVVGDEVSESSGVGPEGQTTIDDLGTLRQTGE